MAALPDELIDLVALAGPPDHVRERLAVYRDAGVGTLGITPMAWDRDGASSSCGSSRSLPPPDRPLRLLLGAFGDPGHAFPLIALGGALWRAGTRCAADVDALGGRRRAAGMAFEAAPEYHVFPTRERPLKPYEAVVRATGVTRPLVASLRPDAVVADILTLAPALAGRARGRAGGDGHPPPRSAYRARLAAVLAGGAAAADRARAGACGARCRG